MSICQVSRSPLLPGHQVNPRKTPEASIFYCNGIIASLASAQQAADKVGQIAKQKVQLHFNDTTSLSRVAMDTAEGVAGIACIIGALRAEKKSTEQKVFAGMLLLLGVGLEVDALSDYSRIQRDKRDSAEALAQKVERFLARNPKKMATLVLHSQGAHIGYMALERLRPLKNRINVISIGSMIKIPSSFGLRVENLRHTNDLVSKGAHAIFDSTLHRARTKGPGPYPGQRTVTHISQTNTDCMVCHGAEDYISSYHFQSTLRGFVGGASAI